MTKRDYNKITYDAVKRAKVPTNFSRLSRDSNVHRPYLKTSINFLCRTRKIRKFRTVNGYFYALRGWRP